jgi:ankyrin repeat protein
MRLSAVPIPEVGKYTENVHYDMDCSITTTKFEDAISNVLFSAHALVEGCEDDLRAGTHQVVLGTLHSHVIGGNDKMLEAALANVLRSSVDDASDHNMVTVDSSIIDSRDLNWKTPLHYACERRQPHAISLLVNAGANCTSPIHSATTPLHLCAERLDDKSLSIILSATRPSRPE